MKSRGGSSPHPLPELWPLQNPTPPRSTHPLDPHNKSQNGDCSSICLHAESDGFAGERLNKDLHAAEQQERHAQVQCALLLDSVETAWAQMAADNKTGGKWTASLLTPNSTPMCFRVHYVLPRLRLLIVFYCEILFCNFAYLIL